MEPGDFTARGFSKQRGLTLIEVLIALGILLALTAVVLPTAAWALRMRALESARDGVEATLLQARAHARLNGRSVEVSVIGDRLEAKWFDPSSGGVESEGNTELTLEDDLRIPVSWASRRMPAEIQVMSLREYQENLDPLEESSANSYQPPGIAVDTVLPMRLAVLLSDGGALSGTPVVLVGEDGEALLVKVDPWTGRPLIDKPPVEQREIMMEIEPEPEEELALPEAAP